MTKFPLAAAPMLAALLLAGAGGAGHREAPFITTSPKVGGTDFYMFRSHETSLWRPELLQSGPERTVRGPPRQQR